MVAKNEEVRNESDILKLDLRNSDRRYKEVEVTNKQLIFELQQTLKVVESVENENKLLKKRIER